jgi:hypothetical protein
VNSTFIGDLFTHLFMLVIGILFIIPTYKLYSYCIFRYQAVSVYGEVTRPAVGKYLGARPLITYKDAHGVSHEIKSEINYYWFLAPKKGDRLKLFYRKDDPETAMCDSLLHYIFLPLVFFSIGAFIILRLINTIGSYAGRPKRT